MGKLEQFHRPLAIYAHPDDEIIGCSSAIDQSKDRIQIAYATDGMPSPIDDPSYYAPNTQHEYGESYRLMRRKEALNALSALGVEDSSRVHFLDLPDSRLIDHFVDLIASIREMIQQMNPDLIITAAYEGGHIDHDILTAAIWYSTKGKDLTICETPLYSLDATGRITHNMSTNRHHDWESCEVFSSQVSTSKKSAFVAYDSQCGDLQYFSPLATELYYFTHRRETSRGDFSTPPNEGRVLYAQTPGGVQFKDFQAALVSSTSSLVKL